MLDMTPKKALGQHWLYDETTLKAICDAADVSAGDNVLEIGPGLGTLTRRLLERGAFVQAVEFDSVLAEALTERLRSEGVTEQLLDHLTVTASDILRFDLRTLPAGYKVVANIPYYLTSNLIRVLCESTNSFTVAAILIQKEVAARVVASPGNMSLLSVSTQYYCECSLGIPVPKELFVPPPKVDSQVLVLHKRMQPLFSDVLVPAFFQLVRAGFSQKRKTLLNSLHGGLAQPKEVIRAALIKAGIPAEARAQTLSLAQWHGLYLVMAGTLDIESRNNQIKSGKNRY